MICYQKLKFNLINLKTKNNNKNLTINYVKKEDIFLKKFNIKNKNHILRKHTNTILIKIKRI